MIPILYEANEKAFNSMGLGGLTDSITCIVTEEYNGLYEAVITYPMNSDMFDELKVNRIVMIQPAPKKELQPFRIYKISKPLNGIVTINLQHISYDLLYIPVKPFEATGITNAINGLVSNSMISNPFTMWTNISNQSTTYYQDSPSSFRGRLGGVRGSILDRFGGVYEWDRYTVKLWNHRGSTSPVASIRYGINLIDLNQEEEITSTYTGVVAYWHSEEDITVTGDIQYVSNHESYPNERIMVLDASMDYQEKPTVAQLNDRANKYISANDIGTPKVHLEVSFIDLSQTLNYKNNAIVETIYLDDVVEVIFQKLGVVTTAKVIKTEYNALREIYEKVEIGEARASLASTLVSIQEDLKEEIVIASSRQEAAQNLLAQIVANGMGLFETRQLQPNGSYKLYFHNKPSLDESNILWTVTEGAFVVSTDGGKTWNAGITADGNAVLNMLDVIGINADWIQVGLLKDSKNKNYWNLDTGEFSLSASSTIGGSTLSSQLTNTLNNAESYADSTATNTLNIAKGYTDTSSASTLSSAKSYTDTQDATTLSNAKSYADTKDADTLQNANSYTTQQTLQALNNAKAYADSVGDTASAKAVQDAIDYVNNQSFTTQAEVNTWLTQQIVFNKLTNNGALKGLYMQDGELYMNATYVKTGTMSFDRARGGTLLLGGNGNGNGTLQLQDSSGNAISTLNNSGLSTNRLYATDYIRVDGSSNNSSFIKMPYNISGSTPLTTWGGVTEINQNGLKMTAIQAPSSASPLTHYTELTQGLLRITDAYEGTKLEVNDTSLTTYATNGATASYYARESMKVVGNGEVTGTLTVRGSKSRLVQTKNFGERLLYCEETPSPLFSDIGEGKLDETGKAYIFLDVIFGETVNALSYQVFLQKYGEGDVYVSERNKDFFLVEGTPNLRFGFEIKAKQKDYEYLRIDEVLPEANINNSIDLALEADSYLKKQEEDVLNA